MAVAADTPVPTADGWKLASKLTTNDTLFDPSGAPQRVVTIQSWVPSACYEVHFDDGLAVTGDQHLTLELQNQNWRNHFSRWKSNPSQKWRKEFKSALVSKTAKELMREGLLNRYGKREYSLGLCGPLQYPHIDLPVPPYVLGYWLGTLSPTDRHWLRDDPKSKEFKRVCALMRAHGHQLSTRRHKNGDVMVDFQPSIAHSFMAFGHTKPDSIPTPYLFASPEQRSALLEGLIDSKSAYRQIDSERYMMWDPSWHSIRKKQALVESLGMKTILSHPSKSQNYGLQFTKSEKNGRFVRRFVTKVTKTVAKQCIHIKTEKPFAVNEGFLLIR